MIDVDDFPLSDFNGGAAPSTMAVTCADSPAFELSEPFRLPLLLDQEGRMTMLYSLVLILVVLWVLGAFVVPIGGGLIHLLLVIAAVVLVAQLITGRRAL